MRRKAHFPVGLPTWWMDAFMRIIFKKSKGSLWVITKLITVTVLTHLFGIGWGLLAVAVVESLPSIEIKRSM